MFKSRTVLIQVNSLELGGTQINAVNLAKAVEVHGFRSILFGPLNTLPRQGPNLMEVACKRGVRLEGYWPAPSAVPGRAKALSSRANEVGADIVHVYGTYGDPRSAYWGPCLGGRRPLVHTVYEMAVAPEVYRHTSLIIGTAYQREELERRPGPTTLISPPVDIEADVPDRAKGDRFRASFNEIGARPLIAIVSRLDRDMKAYPVEVALRTMPLLADTEAMLVVVGTGSEEAHLRKLGSAMNESAGRTMVRFVGAMDDPSPAYAAADIVLGMGGSAARSLAFADPLIVQGERGTAELFEPGTAASLFRRSFWNPQTEPNATKVLADVLRRVLDDPALRSQLGQFGRRFALENFGLEAMAKRLATVYEESLTRYGRVAWLRDLDREVPPLMRNLGRRVIRTDIRHRMKATK